MFYSPRTWNRLKREKFLCPVHLTNDRKLWDKPCTCPQLHKLCTNTHIRIWAAEQCDAAWQSWAIWTGILTFCVLLTNRNWWVWRINLGRKLHFWNQVHDNMEIIFSLILLPFWQSVSGSLYITWDIKSVFPKQFFRTWCYLIVFFSCWNSFPWWFLADVS